MAEKSSKQTRVFRVEILKPINYTWQEFSSMITRATYQSAQLANAVVIKQLLLSKKEIKKDTTFCAMLTECKNTPLSTNVKCATCQQAKLVYKNLVKKILRSDISLPTFKNNSLFITSRGVRITKTENGDWVVRIAIIPGHHDTAQPKVVLRTKRLAEKSNGYYQILERIASKEYKLGYCQIKKDKSRNKLYLLMSYTLNAEKPTCPTPTRVMGVDLGVATPAYCAFNDSVKRMSLNVEGQKLLKVKRQILARRRNICREIDRPDMRRGHGLSGKYHPIQQLNQKWINFRHTWDHTLSDRIVAFAIKEQAATIHLEDLSENGIPHFLGKEWPVSELIRMITYKGEEVGLKVEKVSPYKTSQVCSRCGTIKENFTFKDRVKNGMPIFTCDCGFQDNADYNAAKNIAKSTLIVK